MSPLSLPIRRSPQSAGASQALKMVSLLLLMVVSLAHAWAQSKDDPLSDSEVEEVREVADQPIARVKLYMRFIEQRTAAINELSGDTRVQNRPPKIHNLLQEYTRLVDELQDNLDSYDVSHSDVRKALKELVPASQKWLLALNKPEPDQSYDFTRKTAVEAGQSLVEQAKKLQTDQEKWFAEHKKDKKDETPPPLSN